MRPEPAAAPGTFVAMTQCNRIPPMPRQNELGACRAHGTRPCDLRHLRLALEHMAHLLVRVCKISWPLALRPEFQKLSGPCTDLTGKASTCA